MTIRDLIDSGKISLDTVVLGELPMTADGCIVGFPPGFGGLWHARFLEQPEQTNPMRMAYDQPSRCIVVWCHGLIDVPVSACYSTHQAAERAAKETK